CLAMFAQSQPAEEATPASALTTKSVQAIGYEVGGGGTKVNLMPTDLMAQASGEAKVEIKTKAGTANIEVNVKNLQPATSLGVEFLTYEVWVVTPDGRTGNIGELLLNKNGDG